MSCSEEQKAYINNNDISDTKLLATAGSGKTFCIIHRIRYCIDHNIYEAKGIHMLTFSKNAKEDFIIKMRKNKLDQVPFHNINTIDSFAYRILGEQIARSIDVSILSYSLLRLLERLSVHMKLSHEEMNIHITNDEDVDIFECFHLDAHNLLDKLSHIKCIFIDEAQDLNATQYNILILLKNICHANLHFIGDPNQNIYQFRQSSDKFLVNYPAMTFQLTKNFRSQGHIVDFCSHLRPYNTLDLTFNEKTSKLEVTFYSYHNTHCFENYLLSILHFFKAKNIPLHKVAILAPTRGYLKTIKGVCKYKGLCYIANLLYKHDILFQQFYNDMGSSSAYTSMSLGVNQAESSSNSSSYDSTKINYKVKKNHINLMTYTASKGLEWDYVIIIDANAHLISRIDYDVNKFNAEKYLLYVACSRPRKNLVIFTKHKYTNPWFKDVPNDKYKLARICPQEIEFFDSTKLYEEQTNVITSTREPDKLHINDLISKLSEKDFFDINNLILPMVEKHERPMFDIMGLKLKIPDNRQGFCNFFFEHLFYVHAFGKALSNTFILKDVENVIHSKNILYCSNEKIILWYFQNRETMTWDYFHSIKQNLGKKLVEYIESNFDESFPFDSYTLVDKFYNTFVASNFDFIARYYNAYIDDPFKDENILFVSLVSYAVQSTHYFYIMQYQLFCEEIIVKNIMFLKEFSLYVQCQYNDKIHYFHQRVESDLIGMIDFAVKDEENGGTVSNNSEKVHVYKLKPTGDQKLKDIIYMIMLLAIIKHKNNDEMEIAMDKDISQKFCFYVLCIGKNKLIKWEINLSSNSLLKMMKICKEKII
jgi:hypothetical protein